MDTATGRYSILQVELPEGDLAAAGVLLEDPAADVLHLRLRRDWDEIAGEDREIWELLAEDLGAKARELGARELLRYLEDSLSGAVRVTDREPVEVDDFERTLNRLYRRHVQSNVLQFRTHLPLLSLRAAAGRFLENEEISEEGWVEAPEGQRLTPDMFVARIAGRSMEPLIPDRSLCLFRHGVTGTRKGRLVLVEDRQASGDLRYAVKRYSSEHAMRGDEQVHLRIHLQSLNADYPSWDLDESEDKYAVVAEFLRVLE